MENLNQLKLENRVEVATQMILQMDKLPFDLCGSSSGDDFNFPTSVFSAVSASGSLSNLRDISPVASSHPSSTVPVRTDNNPLLPNSPIGEGTRQPHLSTIPCKRNRWKNKGDLFSTIAFNTAIEKQNSMAAMREMMYRIAAMQPIHNIDPESVKPPKRRNVKISKDPQSIAARHRRERISERIRILQRLVPGGTRMDTASMLDEAIHYVQFLKTQVQSLKRCAATRPTTGVEFPLAISSGVEVGIRPPYPPSEEAYQAPRNVQYEDYPEP